MEMWPFFLQLSGYSYFIFRFTDPLTQFFRVDENIYRFFSPVSSIFPENLCSIKRILGFIMNLGKKNVLKLPWLKHLRDQDYEHVLNMAVFSKYLWGFDLLLFYFVTTPRTF